MPIQLTSSLQVTGTFTYPKIGGVRISVDQTNPGGGVPGYMTLASGVEEAIPIGEITTPGIGFIKNLDTATVVQFGRMIAAAFEAFQEIRPNEEYCFRIATGIVPYLKAIGGTAEVQIVIFED